MARTGKYDIIKKSVGAPSRKKSRASRNCIKRIPKTRTPTKAWTMEEDNQLKRVVAHGEGNNDRTIQWNLIAVQLPRRSGKQCRERWHNHLRPGIKKGDWTDFEDGKIMSLQKRLGNKWTKIAHALPPGRTENHVKNRWHSIMKIRRNNALNKSSKVAPSWKYSRPKKAVDVKTNAPKKMMWASNIITHLPKTPTRNMPIGHPESPALSLSIDCLGSDSNLAPSTFSALKRSVYSSPFDDLTKADEDESLVRRDGTEKEYPPMKSSYSSFQPSTIYPESPALSLSIDCLGSDSNLAPSTFSALKRSVYSSPFDYLTKADEDESLVRRAVTEKEYAPMTPYCSLFQPSFNPIMANDMFSPSYYSRHANILGTSAIMDTPTPALPLANISCSPLFNERNVECTDSVKLRGNAFSLGNGDYVGGTTPLPYKFKFAQNIPLFEKSIELINVVVRDESSPKHYKCVEGATPMPQKTKSRLDFMSESPTGLTYAV